MNCLKRRLIGNLFYIITFQYEWDVDFNCNVNIFSHNSYQLKAGVSFINQHILFRRQMTMGLIMSNSFFLNIKILKIIQKIFTKITYIQQHITSKSKTKTSHNEKGGSCSKVRETVLHFSNYSIKLKHYTVAHTLQKGTK